MEIKELQERGPNKKIGNGHCNVEILAKEFKILTESEAMPFDVNTDTKVINEEMRLKYRYLDLRSERLQKYQSPPRFNFIFTELFFQAWFFGNRNS